MENQIAKLNLDTRIDPARWSEPFRKLDSWRWVRAVIDGETPPTCLTAGEVAECEQTLWAILKPATAVELLETIERLRRHYPVDRNISEADWSTIHADWLEDMAGYPLWLIELACRRWRNSTHRFAPTPGQLKALIDVDRLRIEQVASDLERARRLLAGDQEWWQSEFRLGTRYTTPPSI